jgi:hypothetical protein
MHHDGLADSADGLWPFYLRLGELLGGQRPGLSPAERRWLRTFNEVASRFGRVVSQDDSYWLSFEALGKGKAGYDNYVLTACRRKHLDHLKPRRRALPLPADLADPVDHQARVDLRLDLEDALVRLGEGNPRWEAVMRLRLAGYTHGETAAELDVSERHAIRLIRQAERRLRALLASYADGD